jgi:hypothetical protein
LSSKGKAEDGVVFGSIQTLYIPNLYSALLGVGLVPSPFVFQGEGGGWGCFWFHSNALNSRPLFRSAERVTFCWRPKSNQKIAFKSNALVLHRYMIAT